MMAAKTRAVAELTTSEARSELEEIVTYFEQPSADQSTWPIPIAWPYWSIAEQENEA